MNFTSFLKLKKPVESEKYSINIINENSDKIDTELERINETLED